MEPLWVRILDEDSSVQKDLDELWAARGPEALVATLSAAEMPPAGRGVGGVRAKLEAVLPRRLKPDPPRRVDDGRPVILAAVENYLLARALNGAEGVDTLYDALQADAHGGTDLYRRWLPGAAAAIALRRRVDDGRRGECHFPAHLAPSYISPSGATEDGFAVRLRTYLVEREAPAEPTVCLAPWSLLLHDFDDSGLADTLERFVRGFLVSRLLPAPHGYCLLLDLAAVPETWPDGWPRPVHTRGRSIGLGVAVAAAEALDGRPVRRVIATGRIGDADGVWRAYRVGPHKLPGKRKAVARLGERTPGGPVLLLVAGADDLEPALRSEPRTGFHLNARPDELPARLDRLDELFDSLLWQALRIDTLADYRAQTRRWAVRPDHPTRDVLRSLADTLAGNPPPPAAVVSADYGADRASLARVLVRKLLTANDRLALPLALGLGEEVLADADGLATAVGRTLAALGVTEVNEEAIRWAVRHDQISLVVYDSGVGPAERAAEQLGQLGFGRPWDGDRVRKRLLTSGLRVRPTVIIEAGFVDIPPTRKNTRTSA